jgi:restriction system protein
MTGKDAAYRVLSESGKPMHFKDITRVIFENKYWNTNGKTPQNAINSKISKDIIRKGNNSKFIRVSKGVYAVNPNYADFISGTPNVEKSDDNQPLKTYSFTSAAYQVLDRFANKKPMHYREILKKALDNKMISTSGKSPDSTMYAVILKEIKRKTKRGEIPRFTKFGNGLVGLTKWSDSSIHRGLAYKIEEHNKEVQNKLYEKILRMDAAEFEKLIGHLLIELGFEDVTITPISRDGGIDVRGTLVVGDVIKTQMAVQVKKWKKNVHSPTVQQVRGSLRAHEKGLIITTSDFSSGAKEEAKRSDTIPIALMNGKQLVNLLIENNISVTRTSYDLIELGDNEEEA